MEIGCILRSIVLLTNWTEASRTVERETMDFEIVNPRRSCGNGGRKIYMVSNTQLSQDTEPFFQIFCKDGQRLLDMEHLLSQPEREKNYVVVFASIILMTPSQPNLETILSNGWSIKLAARRQSDGEDPENCFKFTYVAHPDDMPCIFCDMQFD